MRSRATIVGLLCAGYLLASYWTLSRFPPINGDEFSNTVFGYNLLHGQGMRNHLMDDVFEVTLTSIRGDGFELMRVVYNPLVGLWTRLAGRSIQNVRLLSTVLNLLTLLLLFHIGRWLGDDTVGLLAVLLALAQPLFWTIGFLVRPESALLCLAMLLFWLELRLKPQWDWKPVLLGSLGALGIGIHQNTAIFMLGIGLYHLFALPPQRRVRNAFILCGSFLIVGLVVVSRIDLPKLLNTPLAFFLQFYKAPLFSWPWNPWAWLQATVQTLATGQTYYFRTNNLFWTGSLNTSLGVLLVGAGFQLWDRKRLSADKRRRSHLLGGATLVGLSWLVAMVSRKEPIYFAILFPFLIPLAALGYWRLSQRDARWGGAVGLVLAASLTGFYVFIQRSMPFAMPQQAIVARLENLTAPNAKVMGPATLWFGWPNASLREIGATTFSYLFTGQRQMDRWLGTWKPDYFIADEAWSQMFMRDRPRPDRLAVLVHHPVKLVGTLDTGKALGVLDVYQIDWTR